MPYADPIVRLEKQRAYQREYRQRNSDLLRQKNRVNMLYRHHRMRPAEWSAMRAAQDGLCYLCERPLGDTVLIDHDHNCCPPLRSCRGCRRGMACGMCNPLIGYAGDDPARLRLIASNLERAQAELATRRQTAGSQAEMFGGAAEMEEPA
jgi:hypothetical protein